MAADHHQTEALPVELGLVEGHLVAAEAMVPTMMERNLGLGLLEWQQHKWRESWEDVAEATPAYHCPVAMATVVAVQRRPAATACWVGDLAGRQTPNFRALSGRIDLNTCAGYLVGTARTRGGSVTRDHHAAQVAPRPLREGPPTR